MNQIEPTDAAACVLIVDDDMDVRDAIQDAIEAAGRSAVVASNGSEAMRLLGGRATAPCLIVLDLWMPIMNGVQVLQQLKADEALCKIPVVVATSLPREAPADVPLLKKPINLGALLRLLDEHCTCHAALTS